MRAIRLITLLVLALAAVTGAAGDFLAPAGCEDADCSGGLDCSDCQACGACPSCCRTAVTAGVPLCSDLPSPVLETESSDLRPSVKSARSAHDIFHPPRRQT